MPTAKKKPKESKETNRYPIPTRMSTLPFNKTEDIFAIDPGTYESGYVLVNPITLEVKETGNIENEVLLARIRRGIPGYLVIEGFQCQGMAVGQETFTSCEVAGMFREAWESKSGRESGRVLRNDEKVYLCGTTKAKDSNITAAVKELYATRFGLGMKDVVGLKKTPGPLYEVANHAWQALAVALVWMQKSGVKV